jgi:hypothetical protein
MVCEPTLGFGCRDDREDFNGARRDVIKHSYFPDPKPILRPLKASQAFDPALADAGRFVAQVPFEGVPDLAALKSREGPEGPGSRRSHDDFVAHLART